MSEERLTETEAARVALALVEQCVRNTGLENLHAGIAPDSASGDFSDVKVVTPYGDIPWTRLSRISDVEMRALMIEVTNKVFTFLLHAEDLLKLDAAGRWNAPELDGPLLAKAQRHQQARR